MFLLYNIHHLLTIFFTAPLHRNQTVHGVIFTNTVHDVNDCLYYVVTHNL
jgi:hypothetical protein